MQNYVASFERHGYPIELAFAAMFSKHALSLAISDGILVLSTGLSVPFAIALKKGWLNYYGMGLVIQHTMQTVILFSAITWTFNRQVCVRLILKISLTFPAENGLGSSPDSSPSTRWS